MILISYDGSPDSRAAIEHAGELLGGQTAIVLTVWEPFVEVLAHVPWAFGMPAANIDIGEIDKAARESAEQVCREGAELAHKAGLSAQPRCCSQVTTTANAILSQADKLGASAIVMGSRGLHGVKSMLLGSVSHAVIQHADRTVIVVPSPDVAVARGRERHQARVAG
jgi:nucleotide-binding universal stress UspA family protein